jgi:hypothetical protein
MAPPPKYVKAVTVKNTTDASADVEVEYTDTKTNEPIKVTKSIPAGASEVFPEKTVDMGGWQVRYA